MEVVTGACWDERRGAWAAEYRRELACVSEGLCPGCAAPLRPVPAPAGRICGHCAPCRKFWGANRDSGNVGWWIDRHPLTGLFEAAVPDWMDWRPSW